MADIPVGDVLRSVVPPTSFFGKILGFLKGMKFTTKGGTTILLDEKQGATPPRTGLDQPNDFRNARGPIKIGRGFVQGLLFALLLPALLFALAPRAGHVEGVVSLVQADRKPEPLPIYSYKVVWHGDPEAEATGFRGTSIKSNGFCVEIQLNGRLDTIACGVRYVTEIIDSTAGVVQPTDPTVAYGTIPIIPQVARER